MATVIGTRNTIFKLDSVDFTAHVRKVAIASEEDGDGFLSFTEALAGGARKYKLIITLMQDTAAASLWYYMWNEAGATNTFEFWPNGGGTTPSATTPKFSGSVIITEPDGEFLGGESNKSATAVNEVEVEWECTAKPTLAVA
jgi:hypothetical protein